MFFVVFSNSDMLSHLQVFVNNFFVFLFQFFRTDVLSFCDSFDILSNLFRFVKNFFHFLFRSDSVLCDSLIILSNRQPFVNNYFILSGGVFSSLVCDSLYILANLYLFVNRFFHGFYLFFLIFLTVFSSYIMNLRFMIAIYTCFAWQSYFIMWFSQCISALQIPFPVKQLNVHSAGILQLNQDTFVKHYQECCSHIGENTPLWLQVFLILSVLQLSLHHAIFDHIMISQYFLYHSSFYDVEQWFFQSIKWPRQRNLKR